MDNETTTLHIYTTPNANNISNASCLHFCSKILYMEIYNSRVRFWDLLIMIPNTLFFIYLLFKVKKAIVLLMRSNLQVFAVLFAMVFVSQSFSIGRCIISMLVHANIYGFADRVMWLILRFFLLATELSVVTFGFFFGHLDSHSSIKRVILVTSSVSLLYSTLQGVFEFMYHTEPFLIVKDGLNNYILFGHGGLIFWFTTSFILFMLYVVICLLPLTRLKEKYTFPAKKSFYIYCLILSMLNLTQGIGGIVTFEGFVPGVCILDITTYLYFGGFPPLVYFFFLYSFFNFSIGPSMLFSYRTQIDDDYDDYHLPHHGQSSAEYTTSSEQHSHNIFPDGVMDSSNFDQSILSFSHNPLCPSLTSHPDLSLGTSIAFPQAPGKSNSGKDNKMKTFPA